MSYFVFHFSMWYKLIILDTLEKYINPWKVGYTRFHLTILQSTINIFCLSNVLILKATTEINPVYIFIIYLNTNT